ncbi:PepSY domain-containing protein [Pseudoalteromonas sp. PS5]|uniref:PepSY domain-containing protein n=1 Tax=Pseudoalteromonas sp. PS5 TaxID=1437473 RepID=UPI000FFF5548|nr:PepSY domain-containing protein [Pseudoalteromonas sp. PS5]RXF06766.1 PepSY domain-containing protein [Pseudoalteromonas sp. PS5]
MRLQLTLLALILAFCSSVADANDHNNKNKKTITKKEAVSLALDKYAGRTLKISQESQFFVVRILQPDGRIVDIKVNKKTGEVNKD